MLGRRRAGSGAVHVLDLTLGPAMPGGGALPLPNQVGSFTACSGSHTLRNRIPLILLLLHCFSTALKRSALSHQLLDIFKETISEGKKTHSVTPSSSLFTFISRHPPPHTHTCDLLTSSIPFQHPLSTPQKLILVIVDPFSFDARPSSKLYPTLARS